MRLWRNMQIAYEVEMGRKAIFLDRDGTINVEKNYLFRIEEFEFIPGVPEAIKGFKELGYLVIVITNQSGVARGYYSEDDVKRLHEHINERLAEYGTGIDAFYYCPHLPDAVIPEYQMECDCRKPRRGLFEQAVRKWDIDTNGSWVIGDRERDIIPGIELGMRGMILTNKEITMQCCENRVNLWESYKVLKGRFRDK